MCFCIELHAGLFMLFYLLVLVWSFPVWVLEVLLGSCGLPDQSLSRVVCIYTLQRHGQRQRHELELQALTPRACWRHERSSSQLPSTQIDAAASRSLSCVLPDTVST